MVHVVARCVIKEGNLEKFLQILKDNIPNVLAEDGCIRYEACVDADVNIGAAADPNAVTILETWKSSAHLKTHLESKHMALYREAIKPLRQSSTVTVVKPV
ncbi:MAG: antibiotic biosynthesis monooxygenase [Victivallales bacterium]|nr:antibiotic biosynthesis monooxygenase [Victivallales bacterium]